MQLKKKIKLVTNPAGIAKRYYTEPLVIKLHKQLDDYLRKKNIFIEDYIYWTAYICIRQHEWWTAARSTLAFTRVSRPGRTSPLVHQLL